MVLAFKDLHQLNQVSIVLDPACQVRERGFKYQAYLQHIGGTGPLVTGWA